MAVITTRERIVALESACVETSAPVTRSDDRETRAKSLARSPWPDRTAFVELRQPWTQDRSRCQRSKKGTRQNR